QDDVSRKVEVVFHLARLQVGSEDPNTEFLYALGGITQVAEDRGEQADVRSLDMTGREPGFNDGLDDAEATRADVDQRSAKAHDLAGDIATGAGGNDTEKDGGRLDHRSRTAA